MTDIDAIRDALATIADEAPAADRVRATLDARARSHRQRRTLIVAGGLATAGAATGVAGYVTARRRREPGPVGPAPDVTRVPFAYNPRWLPEGVGLSMLGAVVDRGEVRLVSRRWEVPGPLYGTLGPAVDLTIGDHWLGTAGPYDGAKPFDINGVEGLFKIRAFRLPPDTSRPAEVERWGDLAWDPPDAPPLRLTYRGDGSYEDDDPAVRAARSVRPDPGSFTLHPRFGWLPDRFAGGPLSIRIGTSTEGWYQEVTVYPVGEVYQSGGPLVLGLTVAMGTVEPHTIRMDAARPQPVRGLDGQYQNGFLRFTMPDGVIVSVTGLEAADDSPAPPDLLRVAEEFDFGDWPDTSWAGTR